jgi:hypothetical protein
MAKKEEEIKAAPGQTIVVVKEKKSLLAKIFGFGCLGIIVIIIIVAVASSGNKATNNFPTATDNSTPQKSEYAVKEEVKQGDITLTVTDVQRNYTSSDGYSTPESGKEFVRVNVKLVNGSSVTESYNEFDFKVQTSTGNRLDPTFIANAPNELQSGDLASGGSVVGNVVFEVPRDDKNLKLIYDGSFFSNEVVVKL